MDPHDLPANASRAGQLPLEVLDFMKQQDDDKDSESSLKNTPEIEKSAE